MTLLADRYELAEPLGSGGMARVVAAHDHRLDRRVAVKLVRDDLLADPTTRERLLREARAAARLHHPNAVAVHDVGEDDGRPFIVMELVEGRSLEDRLRAEGRLSVDETVTVGTAVLDALEAAHARGLVHRDVKPSNILLPDDGGVKLADFGIAKVLDAATTGLTATGHVLGTPRYLAPEAAAGGSPTASGDLYGLGVVLYECLAGQPPFDGDTPVAVALAHQRDPVPPLRERVGDIPTAVAATIEWALVKDPAQRVPDAAAMRAGLQGREDELAPTVPVAAVAPRTDPTRPLETAQAAGTDAGDDARAGGLPAWRRWPVLGLVLVAVVLAAALAGALGGGDDADDPPADAPTDEEPAPDEADPDDPGPDDPGRGNGGPPDDAPGAPDDPGQGNPEHLDDLIAELARDPDAAGESGEDLLDALMKVRGEDGGKQAEEARKAIVDIAGWLADGELEGDVGPRAVRALEPVGRPEAPEAAEASALFAEVAEDKRAWGEHGDDLLDDLQDLLGKDKPKDREKRAGDLAEDVEQWMADGELDDERGRRVLQAVRPLA